MSGVDGADNLADAITAEAVRKAYHDATKQGWEEPPEADCFSIAQLLTMYRGSRIAQATMRGRTPDGPGRKRLARSERVRGAIGTLLRDLPELADWATGRIGPHGDGHAESLADLLASARRVAALWPSLDGTVKRFDARTQWARSADCMAAPALAAWQRANPGRDIGKPLAADQPTTRLMTALLALAGYEVKPETIAQHFTRERSAFVLLDANRANEQKLKAS